MLVFDVSMLSALRRQRLTLLVSACIVFQTSLAPTAIASGCHYGIGARRNLSSEEAARLVFTEHGTIAKLSDVVTVYEGGKFYYYAISADLPCRGPSCQKNDSKESFSPAVTTLGPRSLQVVKLEIVLELPLLVTRLGHPQDRVCSIGFASDIFRPPRSV